MLLKSFIFDKPLIEKLRNKFELEYFGFPLVYAPYSYSDLNSLGEFNVSFCSKIGWTANFLDMNCVIFVRSLPENVNQYKHVSWIKTDSPRDLYAFLMNMANEFYESVIEKNCSTWGKVNQPASIHQSAKIHPSAIIYSNVIIGKNVEIGAGTIVGNQGFGFGREGDEYARLSHIGGVVISDNVSIGANCTVVSGTFQPTRIDSSTIIDDHVHIAHNCQIGQKCTITAGAILSGSVTLSGNTWVGPNSSIINGSTIGSDTFIGIGAVVTKSFDGCVLAGNPAKKLKSV